jgi:SPP1 family predicted phage head-tail adaptor
MDAGKLNSRIKLQSLSSGQDSIGQPVQTWTDVATVWGNIKHLSGNSAIKSDADTSLVKASIRIRRRTDINAGMRVLFGSISYDIKAVLPDEQAKQHLDLVCERVN